jgi:hypothetical protein
MRLDLARLARLVRQGSAFTDVRRWPKAQVKKGENLFHGTSARAKFTFPDAPAWFSQTFETAEWFTSWNPAGGRYRVLEFEVVRPIRNLALIGGAGDLERFMPLVAGFDSEDRGEGSGDPTELAEQTCSFGFSGWRIPNNYPNGDDILLCSGYEEHLRPVAVHRIRRAR